ncbi:hypothetical protein SCP_0601310 [Sparassis crispa]|uniref:Uncharacterized protein n=1 Tax=Sparassis crispa TaxID=139825 RepID=A0A401GPK5_9APHY|nr:hypothetical protein SCP_0601310 [Sparassis crispa]GBE84153.1 hypothetical protein SCP_0601310 [Sparassis crispa]
MFSTHAPPAPNQPSPRATPIMLTHISALLQQDRHDPRAWVVVSFSATRENPAFILYSVNLRACGVLNSKTFMACAGPPSMRLGRLPVGVTPTPTPTMGYES